MLLRYLRTPLRAWLLKFHQGRSPKLTFINGRDLKSGRDLKGF